MDGQDGICFWRYGDKAFDGGGFAGNDEDICDGASIHGGAWQPEPVETDRAFARCGHLRIDTHPDNIVMQRLLEKTGFKRCGIIHVKQDGMPRFAYERSAQLGYDSKMFVPEPLKREK